MVPAGSRRISRAPRYSGAGLPRSAVFGYGAFTRCGRPFQSVPLTLTVGFVVRSYNPGSAVTDPVWALPRSLATTCGIIVIFSSSGYLDVSVPRVRPSIAEVPESLPAGCPIRKSAGQRLFAPDRGLSQLITSFFASESLGILHAPFSPFLGDL